jgi:hypothetical protein
MINVSFQVTEPQPFARRLPHGNAIAGRRAVTANPPKVTSIVNQRGNGRWAGRRGPRLLAGCAGRARGGRDERCRWGVPASLVECADAAREAAPSSLRSVLAALDCDGLAGLPAGRLSRSSVGDFMILQVRGRWRSREPARS